MTEGQTLTPPNDCENTKQRKSINIEELENGFTVSASFRTKFVATDIEEVITLVRDALK